MSIQQVAVTAPSGAQATALRVKDMDGGRGVTLLSLPYPPRIAMNFSLWWRAASATTVTVRALGEEDAAQVTAGWTRYSLPIPEPSGREIEIIPSDGTALYLAMAQLEQGGVASDWRRAPEDGEAALDEVRRSIMTITPEYILTVVGESDAYRDLQTTVRQTAGAIESLATKAETDALDTRLSSAEQRIAPEAIVSTVRSSARYQGDLQALSAEISTVSQTAGGIRADVTALQGGLVYGSTVEIDAGKTRVATPVFEVNVNDGSGAGMHMDERGAAFTSLSAPNVAARYVGGQARGVPADGSLSAVAASLAGREVDGSVVITLTADTYGDVYLSGVFGTGGVVRVDGGGHALHGQLNLTANAARIEIENLTVNYRGYCVRQMGPGFVHYTDCVFDGGGATGQCVMIYEGASALLERCEIRYSSTLVYAGHGAQVSLVSCMGGGGTWCLDNDGGTVKLGGSRPEGAYRSASGMGITFPADFTASLPVALGSYTSGSSSAVAGTVTADFDAVDSGSYDGTGWSSGRLRQGMSGRTRYAGAAWFDLSALSGKSVLAAVLKLRRLSSGTGGSVELRAAACGLAGRSGDPWNAVTVDGGLAGYFPPNAETSVSIPAAAVQRLVDYGGGLMLYSGDAALMDGHSYSANYAQYDGVSGVRPRLTVAYR